MAGVLRIVTVTLVLVAIATGAGASDTAPIDAEHLFTALVAEERAQKNMHGYVGASDLVDVARRHARSIADRGKLEHNPRLASDVDGWEVVGENVGRGSDVETIHRAFMESDTHRACILSERFVEIGIGVATTGDELWVVEVFRLPASARSVAAPAAQIRTARPRLATPSTQPPAPRVSAPASLVPLPDLSSPVPTVDVGSHAEVLHAPMFAAGALPRPEDVPAPAKVAAALLVAVVAAQVLTARRLRLV